MRPRKYDVLTSKYNECDNMLNTAIFCKKNNYTFNVLYGHSGLNVKAVFSCYGNFAYCYAPGEV